MKKIILSVLFLAINSPICGMEKDKAPSAKKDDVIVAQKSGAEKAKSNDLTKVDKSESKKHSLLACLPCKSSKE